ncbi:MAG: hypothetical protein HKM93_16950 [Desulfobacteraceae bacterium]|nr:hypothetical protein [Desulfobacteraceae bacterium]
MNGLNSKWIAVSICILVSLAMAPVGWGAESDYYGNYAGRFTGDDSGVWVATFSSDSNESLFLSYSFGLEAGDGGWLSFVGEYGDTGTIRTTTEIQGSSVTASIDSSSGSVSGSWSNASNSGDLTGQQVTSVSQAGSLSGSFSGDAEGTWSCTIASNGWVSGTMTSEGVSADFEGGTHPDGYVIGMGTDVYDDDFLFYGAISGSSVSGTWESESGNEGTVSGSTGSSGGSSGGGGGGGGGCFIGSLFVK